MKILDLSIKEASDKLASKEISALELVQSYINSSEKANKLNIYITKTFDSAIEEAKKSDDRRSKNSSLSVLDGIPIGIKDIFLTKGVKTTNASKILENFIAPYESTVTSNLKNAGCISLGKLNLDEFAMGSTTLTSAFGPTINPWKTDDNKDRVPGGSSGGSSAGVSARSFLGALGTDTGGSIRQPAAFTGTVGMKPTYGVCSRYGIISFASSLDQAGPITRNVVDNAMLLNYIAGFDTKDSSMVPFNKPDYLGKIGQSIKGLRVGIPKEYNSESLSSCLKSYYKKVIDVLKTLGAEIVDISLPHTEYALPVYYIVASSEASSNYARFDGVKYGLKVEASELSDVYKNARSLGWGEEVKRRVLLGTFNLLEENYGRFLTAAKVRRLVTNDFIDSFKKIDVILTPTTTSEAFTLDNMPSNPMEIYLSDVFTVTSNLAGVPAISFPVGLGAEGLPLGMQLIGNYFAEDVLYQISHAIEQELQFNGISTFVKENNLS